jgi:hypothetical protein
MKTANGAIHKSGHAGGGNGSDNGSGNDTYVKRLAVLLTSNPYATLFCRNDKIWLQQGVLSQPFALSIAIDVIFATQIVSWP